MHADWFLRIFTDDTPLSTALENLFHDQDVLQFLRINRHQEVLWYHKESIEMLFHFLTAVAIIGLLTDSEPSKSELRKQFALFDDLLTQIQKAEQESGYQVEKLVEAIQTETK